MKLAGMNKNQRCNAYTLAEMLIVLMIIMMVLLALPQATKKVFKLTDTRKSHGRYECYWQTQSDGTKKLMTYTAEENGRKIESESKYASDNKCVFKPTANTIYFMIHAVGGGGAGAVIGEEFSELEAAEPKSQAISYLTPSAEGSWPKWVSWVKNTKSCSDIPWCKTVFDSVLKEDVEKYNTNFDVNMVSGQQILRYRLGGTAAKVVSMFVSQMPGNATIEIYPGKGGDMKRTDDGSGESGEDTVINFVYPDKKIEALRARGGTGGIGNIDGRQSFTLVGGPATDFELSTKAAIKGQSSGFGDIVESAEQFDAMKSKVPQDAGTGGNGETQFVTETAGNILYEYDNNNGLAMVIRRVESSWINATNLISKHFYTHDNFPTKPSCENVTLPTFVLKRNGYCDLVETESNYSKNVYKCAVGRIPATVINDITGGGNPTNNTWSKFTVTHTLSTNLVEISPNPTAFSASTPYFDCTFDTNYRTITCNTQLSSVAVHKCTQKNSTYVCANGDKPLCPDSDGKYKECGSNVADMKCPAHAGGNGAVVILW